jgi:hypothetical protein
LFFFFFFFFVFLILLKKKGRNERGLNRFEECPLSYLCYTLIVSSRLIYTWIRYKETLICILHDKASIIRIPLLYSICNGCMGKFKEFLIIKNKDIKTGLIYNLFYFASVIFPHVQVFISARDTRWGFEYVEWR